MAWPIGMAVLKLGENVSDPASHSTPRARLEVEVPLSTSTAERPFTKRLVIAIVNELGYDPV